MLFSLMTFGIAVFAFYSMPKSMDDVLHLIVKLAGLFSLFLSLAYSPWFVKLLLLLFVVFNPICTRKPSFQQVCWSSLGATCSKCSSSPP